MRRRFESGFHVAQRAQTPRRKPRISGGPAESTASAVASLVFRTLFVRGSVTIGLALTFGLAGGCVPKPVVRPAYYGETDSLPVLVQKINAQNNRIESLRGEGTFSADLVDPKTKDHTGGSGDIVLLYMPPKNMRLVGTVFGDRLFDIGTNADRYWLIQPNQKTMYWGTFAGLATGRAAQLPVRPDLIAEVLGVTPLSPDLLKDPAPTLRFNNDQDCYMLTWQTVLADRFATQKEVWYDRQTLQPRLVLLFDVNGRVVLRAYPTEPQAVEGYDPEIKVPSKYDLFFPDSGSTFSIHLKLLQREQEGAPSKRNFVFPQNPPKVTKVESLDR